MKSKCQNISSLARKEGMLLLSKSYFVAGLLRHPDLPDDQRGQHGQSDDLPLPVHPCHDIRHDMRCHHGHLMTSKHSRLDCEQLCRVAKSGDRIPDLYRF